MKRSGPPQRNVEKLRAWRQRSAATAQDNARERARTKPRPGHRAPTPAQTAPRQTQRIKPRSKPEEPGKAEAAAAFKVAVCGSLDSRMEAHHVIPRQALVRIARSLGRHGPAYWAVVYDPRAGAPLAQRRHEQHTHGFGLGPIAREDLPAGVLARVAEAIAEYGPEAQVAFEREHPTREELAKRR